VADAPLLSPSSRYFLVLIIYLKFRKLTIIYLKVRKFTCLDSSKNIFFKLSIILLSDNNCLFDLPLNNGDFCLSRII
jgi:hypothetical protein